MGRLILLTIAYAGMVFGANSGGKPDFSGNWLLNLDKSHFGKSHKPDGMTLTVKRNGETMHAVQTTQTPGGPMDFAGDWILDGQQHDYSGPMQGKVVSRWEGNTLYSERKSNDGSFDQKIYLTLSSDGKTATEKVITKGTDGTNTATLIWERK